MAKFIDLPALDSTYHVNINSIRRLTCNDNLCRGSMATTSDDGKETTSQFSVDKQESPFSYSHLYDIYKNNVLAQTSPQFVKLPFLDQYFDTAWNANIIRRLICFDHACHGSVLVCKDDGTLKAEKFKVEKAYDRESFINLNKLLGKDIVDAEIHSTLQVPSHANVSSQKNGGMNGISGLSSVNVVGAATVIALSALGAGAAMMGKQ